MVVQGLGLHTVTAGVLSLVGDVPHVMQYGQKTKKREKIGSWSEKQICLDTQRSMPFLDLFLKKLQQATLLVSD